MYKIGENVISLIDDFLYEDYGGCNMCKQLLKKGKTYTILNPYDPYAITLKELPQYSYTKETFMSLSEQRKEKLKNIEK